MGNVATTTEPAAAKPAICGVLDGIVSFVGDKTAWLANLLIALIIVNVIMRYIFDNGLVILEELQWHTYGIMLILAIPYAVVTNDHIRMDLVASRFSERTTLWVEILGMALLLLPMIAIVWYFSLDYLASSWRVSEASDAPMGLCCRWAFKAFLTLGFTLFGLAAISRLIATVSQLFGGNKPATKS